MTPGLIGVMVFLLAIVFQLRVIVGVLVQIRDKK